MKPWALWLIHHRMAWLLKAIVIAAYPLHILAYWERAWDDITYTLGMINIHKILHEESK